MFLLHGTTNLQPVFSIDLHIVRDMPGALPIFLFGGRFILPVHSALGVFLQTHFHLA